jgi:hypothetical protein
VAIAAALADRAAPGQALATEEVRMLGAGDRLAFKAAGELVHDGVARPVFTAVRG